MCCVAASVEVEQKSCLPVVNEQLGSCFFQEQWQPPEAVIRGIASTVLILQDVAGIDRPDHSLPTVPMPKASEGVASCTNICRQHAVRLKGNSVFCPQSNNGTGYQRRKRIELSTCRGRKCALSVPDGIQQLSVVKCIALGVQCLEACILFVHNALYHCAAVCEELGKHESALDRAR